MTKLTPAVLWECRSAPCLSCLRGDGLRVVASRSHTVLCRLAMRSAPLQRAENE